MTIIALEGPSAVGKTTTAKALCEEFDGYRVPEVNERFDTSEEDSDTWYFERQCDRWELARERETEHELVVLDGDVLQPLWYNWIASGLADDHETIEALAPLDSIYRFYCEKMQDQRVGFPDRYFLLLADSETLRRRKRDDETRRRRNFETHLQFVAPQREYFERLQSLSPELVRFVRARNVERNCTEIEREIPSSDQSTAGRYATELLDSTFEWASETTPDGV